MSNYVIKLPMLQNGASLTVRTQPNMSSAVVAWNASSDECHIVLSKTRRAVFAQLIIFACLAFPAAQHGFVLLLVSKSFCTEAHNNCWRHDYHTQFYHFLRCPVNSCFVLLWLVILRSSIATACGVEGMGRFGSGYQRYI